jgi:hypothetical protein
MNFILPLQAASPAGSFYSFLDNISTGLQNSVNSIVDNITPNLQAIAAVLFAIYVAYRLFSAWIKPAEPIHPSTLVRPIVILAAMSLYKPLVELLLIAPGELFSGIVTEGVGNTNASLKTANLQRFVDAVTGIQDTGGANGSGIYDLLSFNPLLEVIHFLLYIAGSLVIFYMLIRQLVLKSIYFILGIFVLPLSLIPSNEKALTKWFMGFLSIILWVPLLDIIMALIVTVDIRANLFGGTNGYYYQFPLLTVGVQVIFIFLILKVPTFANILVGGEGSAAGAGLKTAKSMVTNKMLSGGGKKSD